MSDIAYKNTDHLLWRAKPGDFYSDSVHVTESGGIGINVGGTVIVRTPSEWHQLDRELAEARLELEEIRGVIIRIAASMARCEGGICDDCEEQVKAWAFRLRCGMDDAKLRAAQLRPTDQ